MCFYSWGCIVLGSSLLWYLGFLGATVCLFFVIYFECNYLMRFAASCLLGCWVWVSIPGLLVFYWLLDWIDLGLLL